MVLSVMNGFDAQLRERVLGVLPHGTLIQADGEASLADWPQTLAVALEHPAVISATPVNSGRALLVGGGQLHGVTFDGIHPAYETGARGVRRFLVDGSVDNLVSGKFRMLIGGGLARKLGTQPGDKVTLVMPEARFGIGGVASRTKRFEVTGHFEVGADMDSDTVFIHIDDAAKLLRRTGTGAIRLGMRDLFDAPLVVREVLDSLALPGVYGTTWMQTHGNLYGAIQMQKSTMFLLLLLLIAVAAFNVVSSLFITVTERREDIAVLRTLGAPRSAILLLFFTFGSLVGTVGVALGLLSGFVLSITVSDIYAFVDHVFSLGLMDEYFIHYLPSEVHVGDIVSVAAASFGITLVASLYPALRAAATDPVEILQYEA